MEITDGLTTDMSYAVYALAREFGPPDRQQSDAARYYGVFTKPPYEAAAILQVMRREWNVVAYPVCPTLGEVAGDRCYPNLAALPQRVDCVISLLPTRRSAAGKEALIGAYQLISRVDYRPTWDVDSLAREMQAAHISQLWRLFGPFFNPLTGREREAYRAAGIRVIEGCPLLHWDLSSLPASERARHACYLHGLRSSKVRSQAE